MRNNARVHAYADQYDVTPIGQSQKPSDEIVYEQECFSWHAKMGFRKVIHTYRYLKPVYNRFQGA
jgi:hypothetical protein